MITSECQSLQLQSNRNYMIITIQTARLIMSKITKNEINQFVWKACDTFRGLIDPSQYKDYILTMLFIKYVSDVNIQFFQDGKSFTLLNQEEEKLQLQILNINGQLVTGMNINRPVSYYQNENLPAGIYLVAIQSKDAVKTFKWCKAK